MKINYVYLVYGKYRLKIIPIVAYTMINELNYWDE